MSRTTDGTHRRSTKRARSALRKSTPFRLHSLHRNPHEALGLLFLVKNQPIATFRHKTILQLLQDGRTEDAIDYLESISAGFVG